MVDIWVAMVYKAVSIEAALLLTAMFPSDILVEERKSVAAKLRFLLYVPQSTPVVIKSEERRYLVARWWVRCVTSTVGE